MNQNPSPADMELYRAVDDVLHYVWDPIGICGIPEARDEYHNYLPHVFGMLQNGSDITAIANYLTIIATETIGLNKNRERDFKAAQTLLDLKIPRSKQI
jgi:hypothetical protein